MAEDVKVREDGPAFDPTKRLRGFAAVEDFVGTLVEAMSMSKNKKGVSDREKLQFTFRSIALDLDPAGNLFHIPLCLISCCRFRHAGKSLGIPLAQNQFHHKHTRCQALNIKAVLSPLDQTKQGHR